MKNALFGMLMVVAGRVAGQAQLPEYPTDYFRNPLDIPIFLAGNFGECRPGHFHSGMDIKTLGVENQPVHAAADGYVSRIKMEKGGFGHGLYITHPNGYTTLYAHLNDFAPEIQKYVRQEQYRQEKWDVDLTLSPDQFPVKKGQQVAWSGNTGASTAPHLHFEIRDTKTEHPLNGELFGFTVVDKLPPVLTSVTLYAGNIYEDAKTTLPLAKVGNAYRPGNPKKAGDCTVQADTVTVWNAQAVGIGIDEDDYMDGSDNTLAPLTLSLYADDSLQCRILLDDIGYDETRYINAYADYAQHHDSHRWSECLFKLPGNHLNSIYKSLNPNAGRLDLSDGRMRKVRIEVADDRGNISRSEFYVKPALPYAKPVPPPHSEWFRAGYENKVNDPNITFTLDARQLYDDINFVFAKKAGHNPWSDTFCIHDAKVPLHHYFELNVKPGKPVPFALRGKVVLMYADGDDEEGYAAQPVGEGRFMAKVRNFGKYWLDIDTVPPVIRPVQASANYSKSVQITLNVKDEATSVRRFSGHIDGKWVCFEQHGNLFFYKFDGHCPRGKHRLEFEATDENGNTSKLKLDFVR
jgi:Peptidase family M23